MKFAFRSALAMGLLAASSFGAQAADLLDPTPVAQQTQSDFALGAVDGLNFKFSVLGGAYDRNVLDTASNFMFVGSIATPLSFISDNFGMQVDAAAGLYDSDFASAAAGLHLFWRDPSRGMIGIYGDWAYVDPEHAGRVGGEVAFYDGPWSLDIFAGMQFGQHVFTEFVDEVDLSYYFTDNTRGSIGHRLTSRGHVGNVSFEHMFANGWSALGEVEMGEDEYVAGWGGLRYSFGSGSSTTLIERDRQGGVKTRIPRNIASVTQCGRLDVPEPETSLRAAITTLCSDEDEINSLSTAGIAKMNSNN